MASEKPLSSRECFCEGEKVFTPICKECQEKPKTLKEKGKQDNRPYGDGRTTIYLKKDVEYAVERLRLLECNCDYLRNVKRISRNEVCLFCERIDDIFGEFK